jgi:hypothetical protein
MKQNTLLIGIGFLVLFLAGCGSATKPVPPPPDGNTPVAWVNGDVIVRAEFEEEMLLQRGTVAADFVQRHGPVNGGDFWHTLRDGETASDMLKRATLDAMVRVTVQRALMRENGIAVPKDYDAFLASWKAENKRRAEVLAAGGIIYGPRQYTLAVWRDYWFSNSVIELKRRLAQNRLVIPELEMRARYTALKAAGQPMGQSFEDARIIVQAHLLDEHYEALIDSLVKKARVEINPAAEEDLPAER